jgi:hypothetical protein
MDRDCCARCFESECCLLGRADGSLLCDDCLVKGRDELGHALGGLGFGRWELESTGGGCHAWVCRFHDGRYLMVMGEDVLDGFGDASDFGEWVTVGLYDADGFESEGAGEPWPNHLQQKGSGSFDLQGIVGAVDRMVLALGVEKVGERVAYTVTLRFVTEWPIMSDVLDEIGRGLVAQIDDCPTVIGVMGSVSLEIAGRRLQGGEC